MYPMHNFSGALMARSENPVYHFPYVLILIKCTIVDGGGKLTCIYLGVRQLKYVLECESVPQASAKQFMPESLYGWNSYVIMST